MSTPRKPQPAKLVIGLLLNDKNLLAEVAEELQGVFGAIDWCGPWLDFDYTDYYAAEMGSPLYRRMLVFKKLIDQMDLASIKLHTNQIEQKYAQAGQRRVNIDPGYLLFERFVLATGKNYAHRIHVGHGIYADLTLIYQQGAYRPLPWTYPDYQEKAIGEFLLEVRRKYGEDIRSKTNQQK